MRHAQLYPLPASIQRCWHNARPARHSFSSKKKVSLISSTREKKVVGFNLRNLDEKKTKIFGLITDEKLFRQVQDTECHSELPLNNI